METTQAFTGLSCADCGARVEAGNAAGAGRCPDCGGALAATYDLESVDAEALRDGRSVWDRAAVLPFPAEDAVTAAEGGTPLVDAPRLADELDVASVDIKDEGRNPTGTVHDRGMSVAVTAAAGTDTELLACASPGNAGQSMAAYAGRVDLRSYSFTPTRSPFSNKALINVHGGEMKVVPGRYPDAVEALDEQLVSEYRSLSAFATPYRREGTKTLAYELLADRDWTAPDAVVVPAGTGEVVVGLVDGLRECRDLGLVDEIPPVYAAQPSGCAPIATAWEADADAVEEWATPDTIVGELEIPDPPAGDAALAALRETDGGAVAVDDDDILESAVVVAARETVEMGAAGGAAAAGAWSLAEDGVVGADDEVVVVNTESAAKTPDILRSHLMGQGV